MDARRGSAWGCPAFYGEKSAFALVVRRFFCYNIILNICVHKGTMKGRNTMREQEKKQVKGRDLYDWLQALVGSVLAVVVIFTFVARIMGVDGHSMLNTLQHNDRLLVVNSLIYNDYQYGDIVILRKDGVFDNEPIVKRVIAVGGQTVDINFESGIVYVDGEVLKEDYIREPTYTAEGTEFPLTVPEGAIFVMGDNRNGSSDSRDYRLGTVDTRYVIGKAAMLIFPGPDAATKKRDFSRIGVIW